MVAESSNLMNTETWLGHVLRNDSLVVERLKAEQRRRDDVVLDWINNNDVKFEKQDKEQWR